MSRKVDYNARNFAQVRSELVSFVKQYYPDVYSDFNDASVGMMLIELNAAVGDMLSYHCLLYTSPSPRDRTRSRMPSSA